MAERKQISVEATVAEEMLKRARIEERSITSVVRRAWEAYKREIEQPVKKGK